MDAGGLNQLVEYGILGLWTLSILVSNHTMRGNFQNRYDDLNKMFNQGNIQGLTDYFNKRNFPLMPQTEDGKPDIESLMNRDVYNQAVSNNFVHKMMSDLHPAGAYDAMLADYQRIIQQSPYYGKVTN